MEFTAAGKKRASKIVLAGLSFIILTSFYDAYLVYKYRTVINELNPICDFLIQLEPDQASVFLLTKVSLTLVVAGFLTLLYRFHSRIGTAVILSLVVFQTGLMGFIHNSDPVVAKRRIKPKSQTELLYLASQNDFEMQVGGQQDHRRARGQHLNLAQIKRRGMIAQRGLIARKGAIARNQIRRAKLAFEGPCFLATGRSMF